MFTIPFKTFDISLESVVKYVYTYNTRKHKNLSETCVNSQ